MNFKKKIVGTLVPVSALSCLSSKKEDQGTFETGLVFLDWLKKTGQNGWLMLPLSQTQLEKGSSKNHVPSPYKGYGFGLDPRFLSTKNKECNKKFFKENAYWLDDYALFCSLRDHFKTDDWRKWSIEIRKHTLDGINIWTKKLDTKIEFYKREQCILHASYEKLKAKAKKNKISLVGDVPYYISLNSPLVWSHQELFEINEDGKMNVVSGILWGHFDRQIWGHPLYKWGGKKKLEKIVSLWKMRLRYHSMLFDIVRLDHVKGFFKYGVIDLADPKRDRYEFGPGDNVLGPLLKYSKEIGLKVFVEDSGHYKLDTFLESAKKHDLAGMKIYRFAYNEKSGRLSDSYADIKKYPENSIVYTSTHDTETLVGYLALLSKKEKLNLAEHAGINYPGDDKKFAAIIRDAIIASPALTVIIPIQDWLLTKDRINIPGTEKEVDDPNWQYKVKIPIEKLARP